MSDDIEPAPKKTGHEKGKFWGSLIGTIIVSVVASGALTQQQTSTMADAAEAAHVKTAAEAERIEKAVAAYLAKLRPEIEDELDAVDDDLIALDDRLENLEKKCGEASREAYAALLIAQARFGSRTVERTLASIEDDEPPPEKPVKRPTKSPTKLPVFQLKEAQE